VIVGDSMHRETIHTRIIEDSLSTALGTRAMAVAGEREKERERERERSLLFVNTHIHIHTHAITDLL